MKKERAEPVNPTWMITGDPIGMLARLNEVVKPGFITRFLKEAGLSKIRRIHGMILFIILLMIESLMGQTPAGQKPASAPPPGVEVRISVEPDQATVGDPIRIELDIQTPKGMQIRFPKLGSQVGDFSILEVLPGPEVPDLKASGQTVPSKIAGSPDFSRHRARIVAAVYRTGEFTFPSLDLILQDSSRNEIPLSTAAIRVVIRSVLTEKDANLKELKKQAEIPEPGRWLLWLALGFLSFLLAGIVWWIFRRRRGVTGAHFSSPMADPLQVAETELRDLLGRGLLERRLIKQFYVALSDIVKRILEAGYGVAAIEKTTDEIVEALHSDATMSGRRDELGCIEAFLTACDLVKFAKVIPSQEENEGAVRRAFQVLEFSKNRRAIPATAGPIPPGGNA